MGEVARFSEELPDVAFLEKLLDRYSRLLYWAVENSADSREDQEDILQDTMERLLKNTDKLRALDADALPSYLVKMVKSTGVNYHKKNRGWRENEVEQLEWADEFYPAPDASMEEAILHEEDLKILTMVLDELPEDVQTLLYGRYILEMSDEEIAEQLGCKVESIRMKLTRARRQARKLFLQKEEGELSEER